MGFRKNMIAALAVLMLAVLPASAAIPSLYMSISADGSAGGAMYPWNEGFPYFGAGGTLRAGADIDPNTAVYGILGGSYMGSLDSWKGMTTETFIEFDAGVGGLWRFGRWSLAAEGTVYLGMSGIADGLLWGIRAGFVPKYTFVSGDWVGMGLSFPMSIGVSLNGMEAKAGIALSLEIGNNLAGW